MTYFSFLRNAMAVASFSLTVWIVNVVVSMILAIPSQVYPLVGVILALGCMHAISCALIGLCKLTLYYTIFLAIKGMEMMLRWLCCFVLYGLQGSMETVLPPVVNGTINITTNDIVPAVNELAVDGYDATVFLVGSLACGLLHGVRLFWTVVIPAIVYLTYELAQLVCLVALFVPLCLVWLYRHGIPCAKLIFCHAVWRLVETAVVGLGKVVSVGLVVALLALGATALGIVLALYWELKYLCHRLSFQTKWTRRGLVAKPAAQNIPAPSRPKRVVLQEPRFSKGQPVMYTKNDNTTVVRILCAYTCPDGLEPYYDVRFGNGVEKQTVESLLQPRSNLAAMFQKGQEVNYNKNGLNVTVEVANVHIYADDEPFYVILKDGSEIDTVEKFVDAL